MASNKQRPSAQPKAAGFDPNAFLSSGDDSSLAPTATGASASTFDPESFIGQHTNPTTGDERPLYANGTSPASAINKSPVDVIDRLKLSAGNTQGKLDYLKTKFEDAQPDPTGNLAVKQKGIWYKVDPRGLGDASAWDLTKGIMRIAAAATSPAMLADKAFRNGITKNSALHEAAGDIADTAPSAARGFVEGAWRGKSLTSGLVGAAIGSGSQLASEGLSNIAEDHPNAAAGVAAGMALSGLNGLRTATRGTAMDAAKTALIGAGVEGARTSMGRLVGTYEATPEEQLHDIGLEAMMNAGGVFIGKGMEPAGKLLGNFLESAASKLRTASEGSKEVLKGLLGQWSGVPPEKFDSLIAKSGAVKDTIARAAQESGGSRLGTPGKITDALTKDSIDQVKFVAENTPAAISNHWNAVTRDLNQSVDGRFKSNAQSVLNTVREDAIDGGFMGARQKTNLAGGNTASKLLYGDEAKDLLKSGAKNVEFFVPDRDTALQQLAIRGKDPTAELANEEAYGKLSKFYNNIESAYRGTQDKNGPEGFQQLMSMKKTLHDLTYSLTSQAKEQGLNEVSVASAKTADKVTAAVAQSLKDYDKATGRDVYNQFVSRNAAHADLKTQLAPIEQAWKQYNGPNSNKTQMESLYTQLTSKAGKNVTKKAGLEQAVDLLEQYGGRSKISSGFRDALERIDTNETAKAFTPSFGRGIANKIASGGAAVYATMHPAAVPAVIAMTAASSPAVLQQAVPAMAGARSAVQSGFKFLDLSKALGGKGMTQLLRDPTALGIAVRGAMSAPSMEQQVKGVLQNAADKALGNGNAQ